MPRATFRDVELDAVTGPHGNAFVNDLAGDLVDELGNTDAVRVETNGSGVIRVYADVDADADALWVVHRTTLDLLHDWGFRSDDDDRYDFSREGEQHAATFRPRD